MRAIAVGRRRCPRSSSAAEVVDAGGDRGAELLGVGRAGVVEAGAVDGDDAQVGAVGAEAGDPRRRRRRGRRRRRAADRVGGGDRRAGRRRASRRAGASPTASAACLPAGAGVEHDAGEVEQHAVERARRRRRRVDASHAREVEEHRRGALLELRRRRGRCRPRRRRAGGRPTRPACVPAARAAADERRAAGEAGGVGRRRVGGRVQRLDRDAVVRRRAQPGERGVRRQLARAVEGLGDRRGPLVVVGRRELAGQHEVGRRPTLLEDMAPG